MKESRYHKLTHMLAQMQDKLDQSRYPDATYLPTRFREKIARELRACWDMARDGVLEEEREQRERDAYSDEAEAFLAQGEMDSAGMLHPRQPKPEERWTTVVRRVAPPTAQEVYDALPAHVPDAQHDAPLPMPTARQALDALTQREIPTGARHDHATHVDLGS